MEKLELSNIVDLICALHLNDIYNFDMSTIEHCVTIEMQETGLSFRKYFDVLDDAVNKPLITQFEQTDDYFFDAINTMNITKGQIELLVKLCIS